MDTNVLWSYTENQLIPFDPTAVEFQPTGDFYKDIATYCSLIKIVVHPFLKEPNFVFLSYLRIFQK